MPLCTSCMFVFHASEELCVVYKVVYESFYANLTTVWHVAQMNVIMKFDINMGCSIV